MCKINAIEIKKAIKNAGMSQREVSMELGKGKSYISVAINNGHMSEEMVDKFCLLVSADRNLVVKGAKSDFEQFYLHGETREMCNTRKKMKKRWITPSEFNEKLDELRGENCDERALFATSYATKVTIGNKTYMVVPVRILHLPEWQRDMVISKANHIAQHYDETQFEPIKVFYANNKLQIVDGSHRAYAYIILKNEYIVVELVNGTEKEIIETFLCQSLGRKNMSSTDVWRASIKNDISVYKKFRKIMMEECKVQIVADNETIENAKGNIVPTICLLRLCNHDPQSLKRTVQLITELEWNGGGNAYTNRNIKVLSELLEKHGNDVPSIKNKLLANCSGANFFETKVQKCKSNSMLYDLLVRETR